MENSINVYRENKLNEFIKNLSSSRVKAEQIRVRLLVFLSFMERLGEGDNKEGVIEDIREQLKSIDSVINDIKVMEEGLKEGLG